MEIQKRFLRVIFYLIIFSLPLLSLANEPHEEKVDENSHNTESHTSDIEEGSHEQGSHDSHDKEFVVSDFIFDHIKDAHDWHILTTKSGHHVSVPLPIILYSKHSGFNVFMSNKFAHGHSYKNFKLDHDKKIVELNDNGEAITKLDGEEEVRDLPLDFSITKNIAMMMFAALILALVFISVGRAYKKNGISAPKGLQGFMEPLIIFVKDDIALENIGEKKHEKFLPYLLTVFFFILLINVMGLIPFFPFGANVTGNIGVTCALAMITFFITLFNGNKQYWKHIFATPGVPFWLLPIMIPIEFIGMFSKPFALMIRLFANITAGHIIVLSLISMVFIFKSIFVAPVPIMFVLFMDVLELLVAFLQAYVFTLLSSLFIGLAVADDHH